ncbi:hypothetical protein MVT39_25905, partial [Salmonella sp. 15E66]|nr:hypothetical protein [Salmonella sp. 15E66]
GLAGWLRLAAAPTFAVMALVTALSGDADMICSAMQNASPFSGMTLMYVLMSIFHGMPWLNLLARLRHGAARQV